LKVFDTQTQHWTTLMRASNIGYPAWSGDSRFLYFVQGSGIFRIPVTGGREELVADLKGFPSTAWWGWMALDPTDAPMMIRDTSSNDIYALTLEMQ
jgi:hypothetical protein